MSVSLHRTKGLGGANTSAMLSVSLRTIAVGGSNTSAAQLSDSLRTIGVGAQISSSRIFGVQGAAWLVERSNLLGGGKRNSANCSSFMR